MKWCVCMQHLDKCSFFSVKVTQINDLTTCSNLVHSIKNTQDNLWFKYLKFLTTTCQTLKQINKSQVFNGTIKIKVWPYLARNYKSKLENQLKIKYNNWL